MSVYYALIVLPLIFFAIMGFVFQSSITGISNQQFLMACPFPVNSGIATLTDIQNNQVIYTVTYDNATSDYHLTLINCTIDDITDAQSANTIVFTESATNWFGIANGYLAYFANVLSQIGLKIQAFFTMVYFYVNAPAEVSGLGFFSYISAILISFIVIGGFMVVRGTGG